MKKNETTKQNMDFSSASAVIGGLDSFIEEGVSYGDTSGGDKTPPKSETIDISSFMEGDVNEDEEEVVDDVDDKDVVTPLDVDNKDVKETSKPEKSDNVKSEVFDYKSIINSLVDNKIFEGFDTIENEEGEEISFEDFEVNSESFVEIIKSKIEELKEQVSSNTTKDLSGFTKHLLEIEKNGGNISQALQTYQTYQNPLDSFDLNEEIDQQKVIFMKYHNVMGMEKDVVIDLIEGFVSKGKLEDEAYKAESEIRGAVSKQLEAINEQALQDKEKKKQDLKVYTTSLRESLNKFDLSDHYKRKILEIATKEENGSFALDNVYYETRNNPEKAAELLLFLTDKEEYKKQISKDEVRDSKLDTFKKLKLVQKGSKDNIKIGTKREPINNDKGLIDITDIFGN